MLRGAVFGLVLAGVVVFPVRAQDSSHMVLRSRISTGSGGKAGGLRGKIVMGNTFQVVGRGVDFNPFAAYRITPRWTAGLGWNDRLSFRFRHHVGLSRRRRVYGPRAFADFRLVRGFSVRSEVELMNAFVPPVQGASAPGAVGSRDWVWGIFVGAKKSVRLKSWMWVNAQLLYDLHDQFYKTNPYRDPLNVRFGVEFFLPETR